MGHYTEPPFSGEYLSHHEEGTYTCKTCEQPLFASDTKFDSGTGWPSFDNAIPGSVTMTPDDAYGMHRIEVTCSQCHAHLGHVFPDGPTETGERYCINSVCLNFNGKQ